MLGNFQSISRTEESFFGENRIEGKISRIKKIFSYFSMENDKYGITGTFDISADMAINFLKVKF